MKIKDGYIKTKAGDEWVAVPIGEESNTKKIILSLNDTASEIWDMLCENRTAGEIASELIKKYGISRNQADADVKKVIETLSKEGILK